MTLARFLVGMALAVSTICAQGQTPAAPADLSTPAEAATAPAKAAAQVSAKVTFTFDWPAASVPHYTIEMHEDGTGEFHGEERSAYEGVARPGSIPGPDASAAPEVLSKDLVFPPERVKEVFAATRGLNDFNLACASKAKNVADTGSKTLAYAGSDGAGSCRFNYTELKPVQALTSAFLGMQATLAAGRRLERMHRFDRLGLDEQIESLRTQVEGGLATDLFLIAPVLEAIANDEEVLQRVRLKAAKLAEFGKK